MGYDTEVDLDLLSDYEKAKIFQVLKRNSLVKDREDRRLWQMAVREQIQRLNDRRTIKHESELKTKTGEWHKDMIRRRGKEVDIPSMLYNRISTDLTMNSSSHSSETSRSSSHSSLSQSTSSKQSVESPIRCQLLGRTFDHDNHETGMDMSSIKAWVDSQAHLGSEVSGATQEPKKTQKPKEKFGIPAEENMSLNIQPEAVIQRDI